MGSIPVRVTKKRKQDRRPAFSFFCALSVIAYSTKHALRVSCCGFVKCSVLPCGKLARWSKLPRKISTTRCPRYPHFPILLDTNKDIIRYPYFYFITQRTQIQRTYFPKKFIKPLDNCLFCDL